MATGSNLIIFFTSIIGIIAIVLGIDVSRKIVGKLKILLIFLILTTTIFTLGEIFRLIIILSGAEVNYPEGIIKIILALFFLATMIILKSVIEHLSKISEKEERKKK